MKRSRVLRLSTVLAACVLASVPLPGFQARASARTARALAPGSELWVTRYDGPANGLDSALDLAVSPDATTVFATGFSEGTTTGEDYATAAYDASTGTELWLRRYNGRVDGRDDADAVGVSPDGATVFVTGSSYGPRGWDFATVAYDASTGAQLWVARFNGPKNSGDIAKGLAVGPDGTAVYVTGSSTGAAGDRDRYTTVAYDASTGAQLWVTHYGKRATGDVAEDVAASPDGTTVFVTGTAWGKTGHYNAVTVAYDASNGAERWASSYNGPANGSDIGYAVEVSRDGTRVFVTGDSYGQLSDYATVAYQASTGKELWASRFDGADRFDSAADLGVSSDGQLVFVTGYSLDATGVSDFATVAYDASKGTQLWAKRYNGPADGNDAAAALDVSPDGSTVFVTGGSYGVNNSYDYATVAYDGSTGTKRWVSRYGARTDADDVAHAVEVSPDGRIVFVTGQSSNDYATVAYAT